MAVYAAGKPALEGFGIWALEKGADGVVREILLPAGSRAIWTTNAPNVAKLSAIGGGGALGQLTTQAVYQPIGAEFGTAVVNISGAAGEATIVCNVTLPDGRAFQDTEVIYVQKQQPQPTPATIVGVIIKPQK